jgi:hypothetical protein
MLATVTCGGVAAWRPTIISPSRRAAGEMREGPQAFVHRAKAPSDGGSFLGYHRLIGGTRGAAFESNYSPRFNQ